MNDLLERGISEINTTVIQNRMCYCFSLGNVLERKPKFCQSLALPFWNNLSNNCLWTKKIYTYVSKFIS